MPRLQGKIAIVTGSSSGIGRAIALKLSSEGCVVICGDLQETARKEKDAETAIATHSLIAQRAGTADFLAVDVSKAEDVEKLVAYAVEKYSRLDIMVNNAGVSLQSGGPKPIWEYSQHIWDRNMAVNATGVFLGCKYAAAQMIKQEPHPCGDRGWILNTSSVFGLGGCPLVAGYAASKHAVMGITKGAAWDCAPYRIHVNAICPGFTDTAFTSWLSPEQVEWATQRHPFRGLGAPEDIANAAAFLVSEENTWITGTGLAVDGGYSSI